MIHIEVRTVVDKGRYKILGNCEQCRVRAFAIGLGRCGYLRWDEEENLARDSFIYLAFYKM